jgi:hypothetical protein
MIFTRSSQSCPICNGDDHFSCDFLSPSASFIIGGVAYFIFIAFTIYIYIMHKDFFFNFINKYILKYCNKDESENNDNIFNKTSCKQLDMIIGLFFFLFSVWGNFIFLGGYQMDFQITFFVLMGSFALFTFIDMKFTDGYKYENDIKNHRKEKKLQARDIYQDVTTSFMSCFFIFVLQFILVFLYVSSVWNSGRPCFANSSQYIYYVLGAIVGAIYYAFEIISRLKFFQCDKLLWVEMYDAANENLRITFKNHYQDREEEEEEKEECTISRWEWYIRRTMSIIINIYAEDLIAAILPLQVAQSEQQLDFVLNVVAAKYILQLDNHSTWNADPKSFTIHQPATQDESGDHHHHDGGVDSGIDSDNDSGIDSGIVGL